MVIKKPPMGWNTWNTFAENINEDLIKSSADALCETGLKDAGYNYLVIDDCWAKKERNKDGKLEADEEKFPSGIKALSDYVHSKGLKFGIYSCCGNMTCESYPGSCGFEKIDAETYASWDVDYLKYDHCFKPGDIPSELLYRRMGLALANSGRDILYAACSWGINRTPEWIASTGADTWRSGNDIKDNWQSVAQIYKDNIPLQKYNMQGCFIDMDMLTVGMNGNGFVGLGGCTEEEYKTQFFLWAMFNSPLIIGSDIRNLDDFSKKLLTNKQIIAINQDPACRQPFRISDKCFYENLWIKHLDNGDVAILIINESDSPLYAPFVSLNDLGMDGKRLKLRDLWNGEEITVDGASCEPAPCFRGLPPHTARIFRGTIID